MDRKVAEEAADAAPPTIAAMIRMQLATGMRPGEVCILQAMHVDGLGDVRIYRPSSHKTGVYGIERIIPIGPAGQAALEPLLLHRTPSTFVFSPQRVEEERHAELWSQAMER